MPCIKLPTLSIPQLPAPLTLVLPALPTLSFGLDVTFCCHFHIQTPDLPAPFDGSPPLPPIILPDIEAVLNEAVSSINSFIQSIGPNCPLD